ncbi:MAG TPA: Ig-like domain repeat protein [Acidobacteriaceae bacterium]
MSNRFSLSRLCVFASLVALGLTATASYGQTAAYAVPRVQGPVDESRLATIQGNTLPVAQARFDQGVVPDSTPTGHMLMVLKRSDAQQKALDALIAAQKDPSSPSYHKWLTPEQFGAQFGVADADVQAVTSYLAAQGFTVGRVSKSKMAIEFSGTTGQVRSAFQTEIHSFAVNGQSFHANVSAPQLPAALAPVVKGLTLNDYKPPVLQATQKMVLDPTTGQSHPLYTDLPNSTEAISPGDLAVIYDIPSTATGTGVTVGVISDSNINVAIPANYRTLFGLPANAPTVIVDGTDPGVNADADLAYAQVELLAATAPQAKVNFYTSATTDLDTGIDFATLRAVEDNNVQVLVFGFEGCEANLGAGFNLFFDNAWQQAAAQGISVIVGTGGGGAAECDAGANGAAPPDVATHGLGVNGYASTPYDTAVGASDFYYGPTGSVNINNPGSTFYNYWSAANGGTDHFTSAKQYIPEQPYNSSYQANNQQTYTPTVVQASGGGVSSVGQTADDGVTQSPYLQPPYQSGVVPSSISNQFRVIPDLSFFGGNFNNYSTYLLCIDPADCVNGTPGTLQYSAGGNSMLAASAFAGVAALVVQAHGVQGNLNDGLYATYAATPSAFHDITAGTNKVSCTSGSPDCAAGYTASGTTPAYNAGPLYDAASGLGSVDVAKLISGWKSGTGAGAATVTVSVTKSGTPVTTFQHDDSTVQLTVTVTGGAATPTGDIAITRTATGNATQGVVRLTLDNTGHATWPYGDIAGLLPGGSYSIVARYAGDANHAPAVASAPVTVSGVPGKLTMVTTDQSNNPLPIFNGQTVPYGTNVHFTLFVQNANDNNDPQYATGSVTLTDNGKQIAVLPLDAEGFVSFSSSMLAAGSHVFSGTYSGDPTFSAVSLSGPAPSVVIGGVPTVTKLISTETSAPAANNTMVLVATVTPNVVCAPLVPCPAGAAPGGSVRFTNGTKVLGTVGLDHGMNTGSAPTATAALTLYQNTFALNSSQSIIATYIPDATGNYVGSTSSPLTITVGGAHGLVNTTTVLSTTPANAINFVDTSALTFVAAVSNAVVGGYGHATGNVAFFSNGTSLGNGTPVSGSPGMWSFTIPDDPNTGLLALPLGQSRILAQYAGDADHAPSSSVYTINVYDQLSTPDFAIQSNTTYQAISAGSPTGQFTLQFTSMNNLAALGIPITLSYTAPAGITCSGAPAAPNFGTGLYATVTYACGVATGVTIGQVTAPANPRGLWMAEGGAALACVFFFGMPGRRRRWQSLVGSLALFLVAFGVTGCGASVAKGPNQSYYDTVNGSTGGTPNAAAVLAPATYTVLVTGTASVYTRSQPNTTVTVVHNVPLKVVVQ